MKKLTILLFSILISFSSYGLFGLFEKTVCVETDAQERNYLFYLPNQQEPFSGKNLCEYENGQKKFEGNIKDGKLDGKWTSWHENGQKEGEANYKAGKADGKRTSWHENGQKLFERNIKDGKLDGKATSWHENGQKLFERNIKDGKLDGKWTSWYKNGQIDEEVNYKDGKLDGKWTSWHENGQKLFERNIKDGRLTPNDEDKQPDGLYYNTDFDGNPNRYTSNPKNKNNCIDTGDTNFNGDPVWFCK
jgi:hypothetical protein